MWRRESRSVAIASLALKIADVGAFSPNLVARVPGPLMYPCARNDAVASAWPVGLFGFGSGPSAGDGSVTRARKALEQNGAFNARTDQVGGVFGTDFRSIVSGPHQLRVFIISRSTDESCHTMHRARIDCTDRCAVCCLEAGVFIVLH